MPGDTDVLTRDAPAGSEEATVMENIAGRGVRFAAFIVDGVALGAFWGVLHAIGIVELGSGDAPVDIIQPVLSVVYFVVLTVGFGQTIGKMALGIKVVDADGDTPPMGAVLMRETVGKAVSAMVIMVGFIAILLDGKRQGWHDKIAGTFVVKMR